MGSKVTTRGQSSTPPPDVVRSTVTMKLSLSATEAIDERLTVASADKLYSQWDDMIKVGSCVGWQDQQLQPAAVPLENHSRTVEISSIHLRTQSV